MLSDLLIEHLKALGSDESTAIIVSCKGIWTSYKSMNTTYSTEAGTFACLLYAFKFDLNISITIRKIQLEGQIKI